MMRELESYFESKIEIPLIRHGKKQKIETLINEEILLRAPTYTYIHTLYTHTSFRKE